MLKNFPELTVVYDNKGYLNATKLCQSVGKRMQDYCRLRSTKELISYLEELHGLSKSEVIYTVRNGSEEVLGTWIHPGMVTSLLWWCSPKFAVASILAMSGR